MAQDRPLTDFEHVLVGFVVRTPSSAYDLKKRFSDSPAGVYQPSAGALVPALRRLVQRGYLNVSGAAGLRNRRVYDVTAEGLEAHRAWLRQPVDPSNVGRDLGIHLMRFAMMEPELAEHEVVEFLADLASALEDFVKHVEDYLSATPLPGRHPALALEHGIAVHRASLDWTRAAIRTLADPSSFDSDAGRDRRRRHSSSGSPA